MVLVQWLSFTHTITIQIKLIKSTIYFSFDGKVGIRLNTLTKLSYTIPSVAQLQLVARQLQHKPFPQNPNFAVRLVGLQEQSAIDNIVATTITVCGCEKREQLQQLNWSNPTHHSVNYYCYKEIEVFFFINYTCGCFEDIVSCDKSHATTKLMQFCTIVFVVISLVFFPSMGSNKAMSSTTCR